VKVAITGPEDTAVEAVRQLLSPWHVEYLSPEKADVVIAYETVEEVGKATVLIPSETVGCRRWFEGIGLEAVEIGGERRVSGSGAHAQGGPKLKVPATERLSLTLEPWTGHIYAKLNNGGLRDDTPLGTCVGESVVMLSVDVVEEYALRLREMLNPRVSPLFRFLTRLPVPYTLAPAGLRDYLLRAGKTNCNYSFLDHLGLDALRYLLVWGIREVSGKGLLRRTWGSRRYVCCLTHDVDTREGLRRASALKRLEDRYDTSSAWFFPTDRYKLDSEVLLNLANHGEIGAHDTRHDGKLLGLSKEVIARRLWEAKRVLKNIVGRDVAGFRAPLLQHSGDIFGCLLEAGYVYDSSVPSWEPRHPSCMGPYGIGTVYPLDLGGVLEVPVSVPQDHQMIHVLGLNAKQTVEKWLEMKENIKELGGICTILMHPDYELANSENLSIYEELLNIIVSDNRIWRTTPMRIID